MGYDWVEQIREGASGDGFEENFWEEGLPPCNLNVSTGEASVWQSVAVRDHSNAERMLTVTGLTPLLVNLESTTSKPNAVWGSKNCVAWKVEKVVHYFVHADKVTTDSSTD